MSSKDAAEMVPRDETLPQPLSPELEPYVVRPIFAQCAKGGFSVAVVVHARSGDRVLFVAFGATRYGVGVLKQGREIEEAEFYPNITMAARSFIGAVVGVR